MADINNSLALQVQAPQIDVAGTLGKIAAINATNASTERTQQEVEHNKFLYKQGGGYTPGELQTQASTQQQHLENAGRIGSAYLSNPSDSSWSASVDEAERVGLIQGGTLEKAKYLAMPPQQRAAVAKALQQAGQPSQAAIEQGGQPSFNRAYGSKTGELSGGLAPAPGSGGTEGPSVGGMPSPNGGGSARPATTLIQANKAAENQSSIDNQQLSQFTKEQTEAPTAIATLQQMKVDAARVRTGYGADKEQTARKVMVALGDTFPALKGLSDKYSNATAAFESLDKNRGIVARAAMKDVDGRAASELEAISSSLASGATTNKGLDVNVSQLIGLKQYQRVRADAAQQYYNDNHTLVGFSSQFNKTAGPAAWIYMALPQEERLAIRDTLSKTGDGKRILSSLQQQIGTIHKNKLDEGL